MRWFEQHPTFKDGGFVALSAYESGARFLDVAADGTTRYGLDDLRGIEVLTFDRGAARGG